MTRFIPLLLLGALLLAQLSTSIEATQGDNRSNPVKRFLAKRLQRLHARLPGRRGRALPAIDGTPAVHSSPEFSASTSFEPLASTSFEPLSRISSRSSSKVLSRSSSIVSPRTSVESLSHAQVHNIIALLLEHPSTAASGHFLRDTPKFSQFSSLSPPEKIPELEPLGIKLPANDPIYITDWEEYDYAKGRFIIHHKEDNGQPFTFPNTGYGIRPKFLNGQWTSARVSYYRGYPGQLLIVWLRCQKEDDDNIRQAVKDATRAYADVYARLERATKGSIFEKHLPLLKNHGYSARIFKIEQRNCVSVFQTPYLFKVVEDTSVGSRIESFLRFLQDIKLMHWYQHSGLLLRYHSFDWKEAEDVNHIPRNAAALPNFYYPADSAKKTYHAHARRLIKEAAKRAAQFGDFSDNLSLTDNSEIDMKHWHTDVIQHSYLKMAKARADISPNEMVECVLEQSRYRYLPVLSIDPFDGLFYALRVVGQLEDLESAHKATVQAYNVLTALFAGIGPATKINPNGAERKWRPLLNKIKFNYAKRERRPISDGVKSNGAERKQRFPNEVLNMISNFAIDDPESPIADIFYRVAGLEKPLTEIQFKFAKSLVVPVTQGVVNIRQEQSVDSGSEAANKMLTALQMAALVQKWLAIRSKSWNELAI